MRWEVVPRGVAGVVLAPDGTELAVRELTRDHARQQPFTRSLTAITIPADIRVVRIQARDLRNGWGGAQVEVAVPGR